MSYAQLTIPKTTTGDYKLYIYSAKSADSINTIAKIKELQPIIVIDETVATTQTVNGKDCYVVIDDPAVTQSAGVTYVGPTQNAIPMTMYDTQINTIKLNNYTFIYSVTLDPIKIAYNGVVIYYSVIGVNDSNNTITHLSKVNQCIATVDYKTTGMRHLYSCDHYTGLPTDTWEFVCAADWTEDIIIGDTTNAALFAKYGKAFVPGVPGINESDIKINIKPVLSSNMAVITVPNPWQHNNAKYNYKTLKSFKVQNVMGSQYGPASEPTYQSSISVPLEKMVILRKTDADPNPITILPSETDNADVLSVKCIRNDGIFYNDPTFLTLGVNKYTIPTGTKYAIFTETSSMDVINFQMESLPNHVYNYTIYTVDVFGEYSEPTNFIVRT